MRVSCCRPAFVVAQKLGVDLMMKCCVSALVSYFDSIWHESLVVRGSTQVKPESVGAPFRFAFPSSITFIGGGKSLQLVPQLCFACRGMLTIHLRSKVFDVYHLSLTLPTPRARSPLQHAHPVNTSTLQRSGRTERETQRASSSFFTFWG